ncbi:glycosyltransferase family 2 protein [Polynucleobacter sp. AP-Kolm-20A-A1]|uniref:glycosyltransferase family 2 protein n=1 Tax=Polynucleobacter sp. AP-Kolm-20A-A1 TaxID=2081041 RepID=UPI001BFDCF95|nr:glycosyltransferase family 2 protein [Polynucleobacter sp. AP-Kolm-20A-A1]QWE20928.1 glycosyltransferase family 2 protein [Polynucleobacter sp. AP-Kolm-20A-A1]
MENKTLISITSPCFNEGENIEELYKRVVKVMEIFPEYDFEYIFIDNASTDQTVEILRGLARKDPRIKIIVNTRNFGHIRSPYWGIISTKGSATIYLASDLQDPPELIAEFISQWQLGFKIVLAVKPVTSANPIMHYFRRIYYRLLDKISEVSITKDATGFGLYDKVVLDHIREINDPYPFLRGLICELGYKIKTVPFNQPRRLKGISKNNFYSLFDIALLGIVSHSMVPIRVASMLGFLVAFISILSAFILFLAKIFFWESFPVGYAPAGIGILLMFGILLFFIGMVGEYVGVIHNHVQRHPIVVEKERINF